MEYILPGGFVYGHMKNVYETARAVRALQEKL